MFIELTDYNTGKKILINNFDRIITVLDADDNQRVIMLEQGNTITVRETTEEIEKKVNRAKEVARMFDIPISLRSQNPMEHNEGLCWTHTPKQDNMFGIQSSGKTISGKVEDCGCSGNWYSAKAEDPCSGKLKEDCRETHALNLILEELLKQKTKGYTIEFDVNHNKDGQLIDAIHKLSDVKVKHQAPFDWNDDLWSKLCQKPKDEQLIIIASFAIKEFIRRKILKGRELENE